MKERTTFLQRRVQIISDVATAKAPGTISEREDRYVQFGTYLDDEGGFSCDCIIKQLHRGLKGYEVRERLTRAAPMLRSLRWKRGRTHVADAAPLAVLPFDYCRSTVIGEYDAAVMAKVGDCDLDEVRSTATGPVVDALADMDNRLRVVRALATILTAAGVEGKIAHLDVADRNVRVSLDPHTGTVQTFLIDWDEGVEGGPGAVPPPNAPYPYSPDLAKQFSSRPWNVDAFALMRYSLWAFSDTWYTFPLITEMPDGDLRLLRPEIATEARRLARVARSSALSSIFVRIADAVDRSTRRVWNAEAFPVAGEYLVALRAEARARRL